VAPRPLRRSALFLAVSLTLSAPAAPGAGSRVDGWDVLHRSAPSFEVEDLAGHPLRSSDLAGKVVVIDFWATWCSPCLRELPQLVEYHQRLEGRTDVALLSLDVTDERKDLEAFVKEKHVPFPIYLGDSLIGPYQLVSFPTKVVLDMRAPGRGAGGVVRFRREGYTPVSSIEARVAELLAEAP
jgi:thiol-disulfide isomerase/thioredoxin